MALFLIPRTDAPRLVSQRLERRLARFVSLGFLVACATGCFGPQTPRGKADEAARELNMAARWDRMDMALQRSAPDARREFVEHRKDWHQSTRILDTQLAGLHLLDPTHAIVQVDVSWTLSNDTTLRITRLEQRWSDDEGKWVLEKEKYVAGAQGLFGGEVDHAEPRGDKHFPTRVIQ